MPTLSISRTRPLCSTRVLALAVLSVVLLGRVTPTAWAQPAAEPAPAQGPLQLTSPLDGRRIRSLRIEGLSEVTQAFLFTRIRTREGNPYSRQLVEDDLRRLLATGQFESATATPIEVTDSDEVDVIFNVVERPGIQEIIFQGAKRYDRNALLKEIDLIIGQSLDPVLVQAGAEAIEQKYRVEGGFYFADVTVDEAALAQGQVVYQITEGPRVKLRRIQFEGNFSIVDDLLKLQLESQEYVFILSTGAVDDERIARDVIKLRNFYRDQAYLDVRVASRLEFSDDRSDATLVFVIDEGPRYTVNSISIVGNSVYTEQELRGLMALKPGDFMTESKLDAGRTTIRDRYQSTGYIFADVTSTYTFAETPGQTDVVFEVYEGRPYRFGEIIISGNEISQDKLARRELRFFPDQLYNVPETKAAEKRLTSTPYFTSATINPTGEGEDFRDALVQVVEGDTTRLIFGGGISSDSGLVGNITLENTNFDLLDLPRNRAELFRGKAFKGAGQTLRLQFEPGTEVNRLRLDFREPYLNDWPIAFGYSLYFFNRDRDDYDETRYGQTVSFGKELDLELWNKKLYGEVAMRTELVEITDRKLFTPRDIRDVEGSNFLFSVIPSLTRDTTDNFFFPTTGSRLRLAWEQGVAEFGFTRLGAQFTKYWTVGTDIFDRKSVLAANAEVGYILGDAPVFERYYAGGIGSMRGFEFRTISPREGIRNTRVGGDFLLLLGTEYQFPLISKEIRGVVFADTGTVDDDLNLSSYRASVGFGIRVVLEQLTGPVPLSFDVALPVLTGDDDDEQIFSFNVGASFR